MNRPSARQAVQVALVISATVLASVATLGGVASADPDRCAAVAEARLADTTIVQTKVVQATATVPEYCQVDGYVTTPGDGAISHNEVNFRVGLPTTTWNSDFYFQGVGGLAGVIGALDTGLQRGYASASTDTGHQGSSELGNPVMDGSWALNNRPKIVDFGYRGVHVATVAAKAVVSEYYGRAPRRSIFNGCSNGGRQGLMEAQRYPDDYDGVISVAPAFKAIDTIKSWIWQAQAQLAEPGAWLSPAELGALARASLQANDARDGLVDGLVSDPARAHFEPGRLVATDALTPAQVRAALAIYSGHGQAVEGHPEGHEDGWLAYVTGAVAPVVGPDGDLAFPFSPAAPAGYTFANEFLRYFFFNDPTYNLTSFDFVRDADKLETLRSTLDATDPDLGAFRARGGKMIMAHGWADPALNAWGPIDYHARVADRMGADATSEFFRLFMAPGMFHCAGGPGPYSFDALTAMEGWLDTGVAPASMVAANPATGRTRPLCPYPTTAVYGGSGSIDVAANFACEPGR
jgi:feruloyl esterase